MKVLNLIKEKGDRLSVSSGDLIDRFNPLLKAYLLNSFNRVKQSRWISWPVEDEVSSINTKKTSLDEPTSSIETPEALKLYSELNQKIDQTVFVGEWLEISQARIDQFASVTEDEQWIHINPERARSESPFRTTVAHGFLTLSLIPKLVTNSDTTNSPYCNASMLINLGLNKVRYPYPVKAGAKIRASKKIIDVSLMKKGIEVTEEVTIEIEGIRRPACIAETVVLVVL